MSVSRSGVGAAVTRTDGGVNAGAVTPIFSSDNAGAVGSGRNSGSWSAGRGNARATRFDTGGTDSRCALGAEDVTTSGPETMPRPAGALFAGVSAASGNDSAITPSDATNARVRETLC